MAFATRTQAHTFRLYTHDADSMSAHFVQVPIQGETLPCLRQTGEGILLEFVRRPPSRGGVRNDDAVWRVWRAECCALCVACFVDSVESCFETYMILWNPWGPVGVRLGILYDFVESVGSGWSLAWSPI